MELSRRGLRTVRRKVRYGEGLADGGRRHGFHVARWPLPREAETGLKRWHRVPVGSG